MKTINFFTRQFEFLKTLPIDESVLVTDIVSDVKNTFITPFLNTDAKFENSLCFIDEGGVIEYLGVLSSVHRDEPRGVFKIEILQIQSILNLEGKIENMNGSVYDWVKQTIETNLALSDDPFLQLAVEFENSMLTPYTAVIEFETRNMKQAMDKVFEATGTYLEYSIQFENELPSAVLIRVRNNNDFEPLKIKNTNPIVSDLVVVYAEKKGANKVIFAPDETVTAGDDITFYLLADGGITTDKTNATRVVPVQQVLDSYSDTTTPEELVDKAKETLGGKQYNHNVQFNVVQNDSYNFAPYQRVIFYDKFATYNSIVTKVVKSGRIRTITLGVVRLKLTEKLMTEYMQKK